MSDKWNSGLRVPTRQEIATCNSTMSVKAVCASEFPRYQDRLRDPKANPLPHMRAQRQRRNDCQGQSLANGEEKRHWYCTGSMVQMSDIYAYNASEYFGRPGNVGRDAGTSIQSGVGVLTAGLKSIGVPPGLPSEADWPYETYERRAARFAERAKRVQIDQTWVSEHGEMPDWDNLLAALAAGGSCHIGTYWPPRWTAVGTYRLMDRAPTGGGGHATEIIWAIELNGQWYLTVWNSHGDRFYLMSRRCYEELQRTQCRPFGGYLLLPDKPVERYVNWYEQSPYWS